ncbi:MAG: hypothetical protein V3R67_08810 [Thermodesulfobacteriota bacterium]
MKPLLTLLILTSCASPVIQEPVVVTKKSHPDCWDDVQILYPPSVQPAKAISCEIQE